MEILEANCTYLGMYQKDCLFCNVCTIMHLFTSNSCPTSSQDIIYDKYLITRQRPMPTPSSFRLWKVEWPTQPNDRPISWIHNLIRHTQRLQPWLLLPQAWVPSSRPVPVATLGPVSAVVAIIVIARDVSSTLGQLHSRNTGSFPDALNSAMSEP